MPIINGSGQAGGNGSVWWTVEYGDDPKGDKKVPKYVEKTFPAPGEIAINGKVEGHDDTPLEKIGTGKGFRQGCFRVRLRFRYEDWGMLDEATRALLNQFGEDHDATRSWYLTVNVPAIRREPKDGKFPEAGMPWEIVWEW